MNDDARTLIPSMKYMLFMRPVFNTRALFSDETENYVSPMEPAAGDTIKIRFRTARDNVDHVFLISGSLKKEMKKEEQDQQFDYYTAELTLGDQPFHYYFEIQNGQIRCFYNKCGVSRNLEESRSFCIVPGFSTPDWAKGAVMYQIYTDRFYNGDPSNDVLDREYVYLQGYSCRVTDWSKYPEQMGVREFYGGDLQGVLDKMDYLQDLGVDVIYFNPLFVSPSNHKYDIQDYDAIDPHFGRIVKDEGHILPPGEMDNRKASRYISRVTDPENLKASNQLFIELVQEAHRRGIRVIVDGVFNHCGSFNKWMDRECLYEEQTGYEKGAYIDENSPYRSFFRFQNEHEWPYNEFYDGWWNHNTLPKLNYESSKELENYILEIGRKWVSEPFCCDGWRLDVAADLGYSSEYNHSFWKKFRKAVKEANPQAIILAEHYGDPSSWMKGDEWDTVMNYDAFMEPATWFFTGMEKHSDQFKPELLHDAESFISAMTYHMSRFMAPSLQTAMNELSNHDHSRFLTRTNHKAGRVAVLGSRAAEENVVPAVMRMAVILQMTWPGAPTLYYGDEVGVCGFTDPDNRRTYPWGKENIDLLAFHKAAIRLHKAYPAFSHGSLKFLYGKEGCLSYGRFDRRHKLIMVFNSMEKEKEIRIPVWEAEVSKQTQLQRILLTDADGYTVKKQEFTVTGGYLQLSMPASSAAVFVQEAEV